MDSASAECTSSAFCDAPAARYRSTSSHGRAVWKYNSRCCRSLRVWRLLISCQTGSSRPLSAARISNDVDTTLVTVGDRIRMTVTVEHAVGARVVWPDSLDLSPFEVLAAEAAPTTTGGGRARSSAILTVAAFELGELEIPSFDVEVLGPGEAAETLSTDRFGIEVVSVGADESGDIRDIRGPLGIPLGVVTVSLWLLLALLALAAGYGLYRRSRRNGEDVVEESGPPPRPAHEVALEAIARIEASPLLERGQVKEYHIEVSEVLRTYVEARFSVPSLEMTTREVVGGLRGVGAQRHFIDGLRRFLDQCDMVKFAKVRPTLEASQEVLDLGRDLVTSSVLDPPDPSPDAGGQGAPRLDAGAHSGDEEASGALEGVVS